MIEEIKNLQELLSQYVGPNKKVVSNDISPLTDPGENYLSVMLKVDVVVRDEETSQEEKVHAVGKCIHSSEVHQFLQDIGKMNYKNELAFYTEIIPTLQSFANERGLEQDYDIFPRLIAYRANLHGTSDEVDENSILLMENMKVSGYDNIDRHIGFDYEGAKSILKDLATFHAVPIALKLKKPRLFENKIKKNFRKPAFSPPKPKEGETSPPPTPGAQRMWLEAFENNDQCKLYLQRLKKIVEESRDDDTMKSYFEKPKREPFATISHNDMWVNNTMQIFQGSKIFKNKFVDFQMYTYDSPAQDLLFFVWSSIELPVVKRRFNDLLKYYHRQLLEVLRQLGCDTKTFSYDKFEIELKESALRVLFQCFMMFIVIFGKKGSFALDMTAGPGLVPFKKEDITESLQERAASMIQNFGRRGWI